jgi:prepilin-type N-terminal cleavage/methylation domain-containing protein
MNLANKGFTLIELLVVIAIIGILAAIILPVYAQARKSAFRSSDMSNMNQLRTALQLYRTDQGAYPPALLGYVTQYTDLNQYGQTVPNMLPAGQLQGALFPQRVVALTTFQPAYDRGTGGNAFQTMGVNPVWPNGELGAFTTGQCSTTGSGVGCNEQRYGPTNPVTSCEPAAYYVQQGINSQVAPDPAYYYEISGYDVATVNSPTGTRVELHYSPWWSGYTVPDQCNPADAPGSSSDNPNQLGYSDPPDTSVVTWDSWFRDYDSSGNPEHQRQDIVLFLAGDARPYDSANVAAQAWQVTP